MTGYVVLRVGDRQLALPMKIVVEVFRVVAIAARLPRAPRHCLGVVDCRGRLVPIFDLGGRLGLTPARGVIELAHGHVLLVHDPVGEVGYAVDEVSELSEESAEPVPGAGLPATGGMVRGAVRCGDGQIAPILDASSLLTVLARHQLRAALAALAKSEEART